MIAADRRMVTWKRADAGREGRRGMLSSRKNRGITVVQLAGILDNQNANSVREDLKELIGSGETKLVLDLSALTFLDSTGLGALLTAAKAARAAGGDLKLGSLQADVRTILERTGFAKVLQLYPTVGHAVRSFAEKV
jgi:anti-sigma B factor antagonist